MEPFLVVIDKTLTVNLPLTGGPTVVVFTALLF